MFESKILQDLVIFEMANSHQGSLEHGLNIINTYAKIVKKHNIKAAIKLQYRNLDTFIHSDFKKSNAKHIDRFLSTRLSESDFNIMVETIKSNQMLAISTPFDEDSVELCVKQKLDVIKVASCSAKDWVLLEKIAQYDVPIIISTGGLLIEEIDDLYSFFTHKGADFALLHCLSIYPCPNEVLQLDMIDKLRNRYPNITIGYSGHESPDDILIPHMAIAKGASILERHIGLPTKDIKLNAYSMNPDQANKWVESILNARRICRFNHDRNILKEEQDSLKSLMRGVYAKCDIKENEPLHEDNVFFAMPLQDGQLNSGEFSNNMIAKQSYKALEPIKQTREKNIKIHTTRKIIHEVLGMIHEAKIILPKNVDIELSHHYGLDRFREYGCLIVNVLNREYCKKLICMLPNQKHPKHFHKKKEESFHVLFGEMKLNLNGVETTLNEGDLQLVERNAIHSFSATEKGLIFEEISTTHYKNDSFYTDKEIARLDPMERKTFLEGW